MASQLPVADFITFASGTRKIEVPSRYRGI
jgi:hypothetical protein